MLIAHPAYLEQVPHQSAVRTRQTLASAFLRSGPFYPVEEAELLEQREAFRHGRFAIRIEDEIFDYGAHQQFLTENAESIAAFRSNQQAAFEIEIAHWAAQEATASVETAAATTDDEETVPEGDRVASPMHGIIWKVLVEPSQQIEADQPVLIIEAMKMEVAVRSSKAGILKAIRCASGQSVATGDILAVLAT